MSASLLGSLDQTKVKMAMKLLAERFSRLPSYGQNVVILGGLSMTLYGINKITSTRPEKPEVCAFIISKLARVISKYSL